MSCRSTPSKWIAGALVAGLLVGIAATAGPAQARTRSLATASQGDGVDASARQAAKQATVTLADLGTGWTQYRKAGGFKKPSTASCPSKRFGSPVRLSDRAYVGPMLTDPAEQAFVYSFAYVFRTKAGAKAYTAARGSEPYLDCQAKADDAAAKKADPAAFVRITRTTDPSVGGVEGLEAFYEEDAGVKNAEGIDVVSAQYARLTYRHGRVVFVVRIDNVAPADAAAAQDLSARLTAALTAGTAGIDARLTKLGL